MRKKNEKKALSLRVEGDIVIHRHKSCLIWKNELRDDGGGSGIRSVSKRKRFYLYRMSPISVDNGV